MREKEKIFHRIVTDYQDRIYRICCYYSKNKEDSKDLFQEILINVWISLDRFRGDASYGTWVYRIALNTAITCAHKEFKRRQNFHRSNTIIEKRMLQAEDIETENKFEQALEQLQIELNQLNVIDRSIMSLYLEKLPSREIARIIGITETNVRTKIHRITSQLSTNMNTKSNE